MDIHTHIFSGVAVGLVFFGHLEPALLIAIGTMLPDLDGDYWYIRPRGYREEQLHRALLHNVFVIMGAFLVSPFLSLGVFLHVLQDSFTTYKDRGCEWFYPLSRLVKLGLYDENAHQLDPLDADEKIYFFHQDPKEFVEFPEELDSRRKGPAPWRRVYGPAQNSQLLDRIFLCCSIALIGLWIVAPDGSNFAFLCNNPPTKYLICAFGFFSVGILFLAGELDRRDKPLRGRIANLAKYPIFLLGIISFGIWLVLYRVEIFANLENIFSNSVSILLGIPLVIIVSIVVFKWKTRAKKIPALV